MKGGSSTPRNKFADMMTKVALVETMLGSATGTKPSDYMEHPSMPSMTAGVNKYAKRVSNEDALTDEEKRRNAEIDAKRAAKKAAKGK
jgi:hypothetical protein